MQTIEQPIRGMRPIIARTVERNRQVRGRHAELWTLLRRRADRESLIAAVAAMGDAPLSYQASTETVVSVIAALLVLVVGLVLFPRSWVVVCFASAAVLVPCLMIGLRRLQERQTVLQALSDRVLGLTYGMRFGLGYGHFNEAQIMAHFPGFFRRGNDSNEIVGLATGLAAAGDRKLPYTLFHYHYVDRFEYEERDSDGDTHTRVEYRHYDRWGLLLHGVGVRGLALSSGRGLIYGRKWTAASLDFNNACSASAVDEMTAARFLQPKMVLYFTHLLAGNKDFDLVFHAHAPVMMWQFQRPIFLRRHDVTKLRTARDLATTLADQRLPVFEYTVRGLGPLITLWGTADGV
jgi:hypothetical protein